MYVCGDVRIGLLLSLVLSSMWPSSRVTCRLLACNHQRTTYPSVQSTCIYDYECINTQCVSKTMYKTGYFKPNVLTLLFWSKGYFWIFGLCVYEYKNLMQIISTLMNLSKAFYGPTIINQLNVSINYTKVTPFLNFSIFAFTLLKLLSSGSMFLWIHFYNKDLIHQFSS